MTDYIPVDCARHSALELAVLRRQPLRLAWQDTAGALRQEVVAPLDLQTRSHEEFLLVEWNRQHLEIRLDRIVHCTPLSP